jgi:hypothetical protein
VMTTGVSPWRTLASTPVHRCKRLVEVGTLDREVQESSVCFDFFEVRPGSMSITGATSKLAKARLLPHARTAYIETTVNFLGDYYD